MVMVDVAILDSALDENENGWPVILNGLPHKVSQPNWPG